MATLSQEGFNLLKGFEGFRNKPYHLKGEKYYTVGLGHYGPDVNPNKIYTDAECMAFFEKDKQRFEADVNKVMLKNQAKIKDTMLQIMNPPRHRREKPEETPMPLEPSGLQGSTETAVDNVDEVEVVE